MSFTTDSAISLLVIFWPFSPKLVPRRSKSDASRLNISLESTGNSPSYESYIFASVCKRLPISSTSGCSPNVEAPETTLSIPKVRSASI